MGRETAGEDFGEAMCQLSAMGIPDLMLTGRTFCPHGSIS
jgi:hypothetical protein